MCRFSDLNLPPKNWTFPCSVANLGDIKVRYFLKFMPAPGNTGLPCADTFASSYPQSLL